MAKLVYSTITSLDGFTADEHGDITWGAPHPDAFAFINDLVRPFGTHLYGRRMYETMVFWETYPAAGAEPSLEHDFAQWWRAADKVVYSRTLAQPTSARTRVERSFDPEDVARLKSGASSDLTISGANLAGQAIAAGLVDEVHLFVTPVTLGAGTPALALSARHAFELLATNRLAGGVVHLHYRVAG